MLSNQLPVRLMLMPFGDLLRSLRSSSGKSLGDTAEALGISDQQGRVKPSRQAKLRQVEEFLRILDVAIRDAIRAEIRADAE